MTANIRGRMMSRAFADLMTALLVLMQTTLMAATGSWTNTAAGSYSWNVNANWEPSTAFPNGQDDVAYLTNNITGNQTIDLGQAITLGTLSIGDADSWSRFIITNTTANALTFQSSSGSALIEKRGVTAHGTQSDVISANMTLASDLTVSNLVNMTGDNQLLTLSGNISENGGARKISFGSVSWQGFVLSGSNTYSGGTALSLGGSPAYIEVRNPNALGSGAVTTPSGSSCIRFNLSVPATFSNNMTLNNTGATVLRNLTANEVTLSGNLAGSGNTFYSVIEGVGAFVLGGNINNSARLYVKNTTVKIAATATFGASCANICLAEGNSNTGKLYLANGATVTKEVGYANSGWDLPLTIATPVYLGMYEAGSATVSGGVQLNGNNRSGNTANSLFYLDVPSAATLTLSGIVKHANTYATNTLVKIGEGTAVLAGANTYGCPTIISSGTLSVSNNAALGTGLLTLAGGTLAASAGNWTIANNVNLTGNSTVDTGANSLTLSGAITNSGGLTKRGSGTLMLSGANTYSGATVISGGQVKFVRSPSVSGINYFKITGDADSGISSNNIYTHAINPNGGSAIVNGIPFTGAGVNTLPAGDLVHKSYTGTNGTITINNSIGTSFFGSNGIGGGYNGWVGITAGDLYTLFGNFIYGGSTRTNVLNGLSPNTWYDVRLYHRPWGTSGRNFSVNYDVGNNGSVEYASPTIDEDAPQNTPELAALGIAQTNAWAMSYVFQTGESETNIALKVLTGSYHGYGISCQKVTDVNVFKGTLPEATVLSITNGATLDLTGSSQTVSGLNGTGTVTNGTLTVTGTLAPGGMGVIGALPVNANLVLAPNATYDWNFGTATQDTVNVTGALTLPAVATVNVSRVTDSLAKQPDSAVLMTFTTGPSDGALPGWVITGARGGSHAIVSSNKVMLISPSGTLIIIR